MTTLDFITELFCRVDDAMRGVAKHSQAKLYPSEIVTLGILFALKGVVPQPAASDSVVSVVQRPSWMDEPLFG